MTGTLATRRIEKVFNKSLENVRSGKNANVSVEMKKQGYSPSSCKALKVKHTKTWTELLNKNFPDARIQKLLNKALKEYEETDQDIPDKRAFLGLIDMLLKLKDRYPAGKLKLGAFEERDKVIE